MKKHLFFAMLLLFILISIIINSLVFSCKNSSNTIDKSIQIKIGVENDVEQIYINDFTSNLDIIDLETNRESLFASINRLYLYKGHIYILSKPDNSVLIFNVEGRFINKIKKIGKGPGEYIKLTDFTINDQEEELVILANIPYKSIVFTLTGEYKNEYKMTEVFTSFNYANEAYWFFKTFPIRQGTEYRITHSKSLNLNSAKRFLPFRRDTTFTGSTIFPDLCKSNKLLFSSSYTNNTIYSLDGQNIVNSFYVNFFDQRLRISDMDFGGNAHDNMKLLMKLNNSGKFFLIHAIREYEDLLIFRFNPNKICFYNKLNEETIISNRLTDERFNVPFLEYFPHDGEDDKIICIVKPSLGGLIYTMINAMESKKSISIEPAVVQRLNERNEVDNPLLFIYSK